MNFVDRCVILGLVLAAASAGSIAWNFDKLPKRGWSSELVTRYGTSKLDGQRCIVDSTRGSKASVYWASPQGGLLYQEIPIEAITISTNAPVQIKK